MPSTVMIRRLTSPCYARFAAGRKIRGIRKSAFDLLGSYSWPGGTKIHADSSLVAANASLNSVRELDAVTLDQIQRACRQQTEKLDETEANKRTRRITIKTQIFPYQDRGQK